MASDGKVIISTELDNRGFEKGIRVISDQLGGLGNTLKNIAAMIAAAFSTKKIIEFAVEASQAAMTLSDALKCAFFYLFTFPQLMSASYFDIISL